MNLRFELLVPAIGAVVLGASFEQPPSDALRGGRADSSPQGRGR